MANKGGRLAPHWHDGQIMEVRQGKAAKYAAMPMHPLWVGAIEAIPKRALMMLYDRFGRPFVELERVRDRIVRLLFEPSVKAAVADAVARGEIGEGVPLHRMACARTLLPPG